MKNEKTQKSVSVHRLNFIQHQGSQEPWNPFYGLHLRILAYTLLLPSIRVFQ